MKKAYLLLSSIVISCFATDASAQVLVNGSTNYVNLTNAFAAINTGVHTGAITIEISASISEGLGVASLNGSGVGPASYTSVTIRPTAPNIVDSGEGAAVIQLKGADNVFIDGDFVTDVTTTTDLTFRNEALGGGAAAVWITSFGITDGSANNTIRNCIIEGVDKVETAYGILTGSHTSMGLPSDAANANNTISNNVFRRTRDGIAIVGGTTFDGDWVISNNIVGSTNPGDELGYQGISAVNVQGIDITNNVIGGIMSDVMQSVKGINLGQAVSNANISGNRIYNISNNEATTGYGAAGIYLNLISCPGLRIFNNEIWSIGSMGNPTSWDANDNRYGIAILQGDEFDIFYNTIFMDLDPEGTDGNGAAIYIGVGVTPLSINLQNNIIYNEATVGTNYAIYDAAVGVFNNIDYNLYYNDGPDLSYLGAPIADLATWKALTLRDTGSVSGAMSFVYGGDNIAVDNTIDNSWFVNGRGIAMMGYGTDRLGNTRNTTVGFPTDIGSIEFTPALGVLPPDAVASAAPANNTTTTYTSAGRKVAEINWGAAGTVPTSVAVKYYPGIEGPLATFPDRIHSYWNIAETGGSGYEFTAEFTFTKAENRGTPDGALQIVKDSLLDGSWVNGGGVVFDLNPDGRVCGISNSLGQVGNFTLGAVPLGLELLEFTASNNGSANVLGWKTADEKDMSHFEIQRSEDGVHFTNIGSMDCRNEFMGSSYAFRDVEPKAGYNYYRLQMHENTGAVTYSRIAAVNNSNGVNNIDITSVYPNPAVSNLAVSLQSVTDNTLVLEVTDLTGKTLLSQSSNVITGGNNVNLNVSELPAGIYMIKATLADGTVSVQKFVKQ